MSLRTLPEISIAPPKAEISFDISARAIDAWHPTAAAHTDKDVITIFDPIGETWDGRGVTVNRISAALRSIGDKPVTVQINSPGGNFFDGLAIYNLLRAHSRMVTVQVVGIAASAASVIAMAGDEIQVARAGLVMVHNAQWIAAGDRHVMQEAHDTMVTFDEAMVALYADRTGIDAAAIAEMMDATTFMSGTEALEQGFATSLLEADETPTVINASTDKPVVYRIEALLRKSGLPRADCRKIIKELTTSMPGAAVESDMPGAVETVAKGDTSGLSIALARLKLTRV